MNEVRIKFSRGLAILAVLHAGAMVIGFMAIHNAPDLATYSTHNVANSAPLPLPVSPDSQLLPQPQFSSPPVNRSALDEIKQQAPCRDCDRVQWNHIVPARRTVTPYYTPVVNQPPVVYQPQPTYTPTPAPLPAPTIPLSPTPIIVPASGQSILANNPQLPTPKKYELALFVGTDARSQILLNWFNTDPSLQAVKAVSNFQTYTRDSAMYKTRYASIMPPEMFPAIIFQHADGAHIHATGANFLPSTSTQLFSDLKQGVTYSRQVRETDRQMTGMIRTAGYSFDRAINPGLQLQTSIPDTNSEDCPDGNCRPGSRLADLFDKARDTQQAIAWFGSGELVVVILAIAVVGLVFMIARKFA
jgi:hypothetical protein